MATTASNARTRSSSGVTSPGRSSKGYILYLLPGLLLSTVVILGPLVMNVAVSFSKWYGVGPIRWIGLANYERLLHDERFWASFQHILAIVVAMAVLPTALGLFLAALLFDLVAKSFGDRAASLLRSGLYVPQVIPVAVTGIVWGWLLAPEGAVNAILRAGGLSALAKNWLGDESLAMPSVMAVMVWIQIGYPVVMFMAGLQRIDPQLYEAADIDGASWLQRFRYITVHLIKPEAFVVLLTTTIAALKTFAQIYTLTRGGPGGATIVPSYFAWQNFFAKADVGYGAAIATVLSALIMVLAVGVLLYQRRVERREEAGR